MPVHARILAQGSQAASYVLGGLVLAAALLSVAFASDLPTIASWAVDVLGISFLVLLGVLILLAAFSLVRLTASGTTDDGIRYWLEVGVQAANGVTTLALTYTLLGISLGIGGLAGQALTPETVQPVIRELTADFSLAFMTTVIGLPVSAFLRAVLLIAHTKRIQERHST